jgi:hypothetical protein
MEPSCTITIFDKVVDPRVRRILHELSVQISGWYELFTCLAKAKYTTLSEARKLTVDSPVLRVLPASERLLFVKLIQACKFEGTPRLTIYAVIEMQRP